MRLFVALDIDPAIRERVTIFRNQMQALAPDVRWVGPETFHLTLQFLGETKTVAEVRRALRPIKAEAVRLAFRGTGFFPSPRSPRVFWVGIESDQRLHVLADVVAAATRPLGFEREAGPYTPHLTLARSCSGRPRPIPGEQAASGLQRVRDELVKLPPPDFGTMTAHEFYLFESHLSREGARYEKHASYSLR